MEFLKFLKNDKNWNVKHLEEILRPTKIYEGSNLKINISKSGPSKKIENAVRDPYILDDKNKYIFILFC